MREPPALPLWTLVQTAHVAGRRIAAVFGEAGLTPQQFGVLACLVDGDADGDDGLSKAELARAVLVRPQSMGRLVDAMIRQGLVARSGPGGRGRRAALTVTDRGRAAHEAARPAAYLMTVPSRSAWTQRRPAPSRSCCAPCTRP